MATDPLELVRAWRRCGRLPDGRFVLPGDSAVLNGRYSWPFTTFDGYANSDALDGSRDDKFHLGLIPIPYIGDLRNATIYILTLNPGFAPLEYFAQEHSPELRSALLENLRQNTLEPGFPFIDFDPNLAWRYLGYWSSRLGKIVTELRDKCGSYTKGLGILAKTVCVLELVPYWSRSSECALRVSEKLESTRAIRLFVRGQLVPRAKSGELSIIVARQAKGWDVQHWGVDHCPDIEVLEGSLRRGAYLGGGKTGELMRMRLGLQ
jgi:hypothetical protein